MRGTIGRLALAVAIAGLGLVGWSEARAARGIADAYDQLATFRFDPGRTVEAPLLDRVAARFRDAGDEPRHQQAAAQYWLGRYDLLTASEQPGANADALDPEVLVVMANAAFRALGAIAAPNLNHLPRLDNVLAAYAAVLKADPRHADAAYNYEFVARMREVAARTPPPAPPRADSRDGRSARGAKPAEPPMPEAAPRMTIGDLPAGATIHGRPGGPPPSTRGEDFQVITPMEYGERESQPEASPGGKLPRKG